MSKKHYAVRLLDTLAILTFMATFSSLVMPAGQIEPRLGGIPYTMWTGFLVSILFLIMAYLVSAIRKGSNDAH